MPLALGYLFKLTHSPTLRLIDRSLMVIIYLILGLMGMGLAGLDNLSGEIAGIVKLVGMLVGLTLIGNLAMLPIVDRYWPLALSRPNNHLSKIKLAKESLQLAFVVAIGFGAGLLVQLPNQLIESTTNIILMALLFIIGIQLRSSNISLRQILLNPRGLAIAFFVLSSSLIAGAATAWLNQIPINHGLALSAGVGWYSLSGILVSAKLGPTMGSVAFLADLMRELIAIVLIPPLMARSPASAIGYGGATAMDFTLPVIQKSGGNQAVPIAIVSGFLLSLSGPILIPLFLSWG